MNPGDTCTPIYQLPYATGASDPCNIGSTGCAFAEAVEEQLDVLDDIVARTAGTVPFAYAMSFAPQLYDNNFPGDFVLTLDTTLADTNNMIDLASDNAHITFNTEGLYSVFFSVEMTAPVGAASVEIDMSVMNTSGSDVSGNASYFSDDFPTSPSMPLKTNGARLTNVCATGEFIINVEPGYTVGCGLVVAGTLGIISTVHEFRLGALWLREGL